MHLCHIAIKIKYTPIKKKKKSNTFAFNLHLMESVSVTDNDKNSVTFKYNEISFYNKIQKIATKKLLSNTDLLTPIINSNIIHKLFNYLIQ